MGHTASEPNVGIGSRAAIRSARVIGCRTSSMPKDTKWHGRRTKAWATKRRPFAAPPIPTETPPTDGPVQLRRLPPDQDRLDYARCEQRQPQDATDIGRMDGLCPRQILERRVHALVEHFPPPECPRQRLDHRVVDARGAHSAPSGVTTSFRPPRFLNVIGMWTVIVSPSAETVARSSRLVLK